MLQKFRGLANVKNFGKSIERFMELNEKRVDKTFLGDKSLENGLELGSF